MIRPFVGLSDEQLDDLAAVTAMAANEGVYVEWVILALLDEWRRRPTPDADTRSWVDLRYFAAKRERSST